MLILGLGSNCGNRLQFLRQAIHQLRTEKSPPFFSIQAISPLYETPALLPAGAPAEWDLPFLNLTLLCETSLAPQELLTWIKSIESALGRKQRGRWAPREIDIDILALGDSVFESPNLKIPHPELLKRAFALRPFADIVPHWKYPVPGSSYGKTAEQLASSLAAKRSLLFLPELVGILNVTPDSFSDGGKFQSVSASLEQVKKFITEGIQILDIGAESTRPRTNLAEEFLSPHQEWERLQPVLEALLETTQGTSFQNLTLSIDTRHPETASLALQKGAHWINDVTGFQNEAMRKVLANSDAHLVMMHSLCVPPIKTHVLPPDQDPIPTLLKWAEERIETLENSGISRDRIIFDPGLGFGKTVDHQWQILREMRRFRELGTRILIGHSRKSFLSSITPLPASERDLESAILSCALASQGVDYIRVHHPQMHSRALRTWTQADGVSRC